MAKLLGELVAVRVLQVGWEVSEVVPVPMASNRRRERGYNHAKVIAENLATRVGKPCVDRLFVKKPLRHQIGLGQKQRKENVQGAFGVKDCAGVNGKSLLLLDDVMTTGATLSECAKTLIGEGASRIYAACVALEEVRRS